MIPFTTKSETLQRLRSVIKQGEILPQIAFTIAQWQSSPQKILEQLRQASWIEQPVIVRSSALPEDTQQGSLAGHFLSVVDVEGEEKICEAIDKVIQSLKETPNEQSQVFVQPMLQNVALSGVALSREPNTGGFYIVINYDESGSTTAVTSGCSPDTQTYYYYKFSPSPPKNKHMAQVVALISELEKILETDSLDMEFAITREGKLYLFQVRPLILSVKPKHEPQQYQKILEDVEGKFRAANRPHPYLNGSRTIYGMMADWNPAATIGARPRPLALSFHKELVTDRIWAYQRDNYGYKNLRGFPLLVNLGGMPYIDVRVSFNSFIPHDIEDELAERLVNYYIARLIESPNYQDRLEIAIVYSCYTLDLPDKIKYLQEYGFSFEDCAAFSESLRILTNNIIRNENGLWRRDIEKISVLKKRQQKIIESDLDTIAKIYWLLEDAKHYGTLPFAGLARASFIAIQLLQSLVNVKILSQSEYHEFMESLNTVKTRLSEDRNRLRLPAFLNRYGHIRPNPYDIASARYEEHSALYHENFPQQAPPGNHRRKKTFRLALSQLKEIEFLLKEHRLDHNVIGLFDFLKEAIEGSEYAEFIFHRSLSDALKLLQQLLEEYGFSIEDGSYADINCIKKLYASSEDVKTVLEKSIEEGKNKYSFTKKLTLPALITKPEDIWSFYSLQAEPHFITLKRAMGKVVFSDDELSKLHGGIILIPSADPGYDWIFAHKIAGFITMYGSINSHMALRAGELSIPAVIGAGENLYSQWATAQLLEIDAANKQVRVLQ